MAAKRCVTHVHLWGDGRTYVREQKCARHHFTDTIKSGERRGVSIPLEKCRECGVAA